MKLFALTFGGPDSASTYYRLFQYESLFADDGIVFEWAQAKGFSDFARLAEFDVVILQKTILSTRALAKIRRHARRLVYDADDRIWLSPFKKRHWLTRWRIDRRMRTIARLADCSIAANGVIAADLESFGARATRVPMSLDAASWHDCSAPGEPLVVGWSGAPKNTAFLRALAPALRRVQAEHPEVEFAFHCGVDPQVDGLVYRHIPYEAGAEGAAVCRFDIGLLPLPDNPFAAGKSPIKSFQYAASGAAVVASPYGAVTEFVRDGESGLHAASDDAWYEALHCLVVDPGLRSRLARAARDEFLNAYTREAVYPRLKAALSGGA